MQTFKLTLLVLSLLILSLPLIVRHGAIIAEPPLSGYFQVETIPPADSLTPETFLHGRYQQMLTAGINHQFGLRNSFVRLFNQVDFDLFGLIHAQGFVAGKDGYLYEEDYIHEYTGNYYIGEPALRKKVQRLKNVTDTLATHGIPLILCLEPGKASFYPEYIPARFHPGQRSVSNYDQLVAACREEHMPFTDLNAWFLHMKPSARYPLFPRFGMHWSLYGVPFAVDTLTRILSAATGKPVPQIAARGWFETRYPLGTDNDIGDMMNLLFPHRRDDGAVPVCLFDTVKPVLKALIIADSYYLNIVEEYGRNIFREQDYWYYNNKRYPYHNNMPPEYVDKTGLREKLLSYDVILLMTSEINLHCGFWNFADEAYLAFHPGMSDPQVYQVENNIRNEREWFRFLVNRARVQKMPLEKMIRNNAEYTFFTYYGEITDKNRRDSIDYLRMTIERDPAWYAQIEEKARNLNIPVDSMLHRDATYLYDQSLKKE
jgi:hypothetical protein